VETIACVRQDNVLPETSELVVGGADQMRSSRPKIEEPERRVVALRAAGVLEENDRLVRKRNAGKAQFIDKWPLSESM
jgi:hypothetical protein